MYKIVLQCTKLYIIVPKSLKNVYILWTLSLFRGKMSEKTQKTEMSENLRTKYVVRAIRNGKISEREYLSRKDALAGFHRSKGQMKKRQYLDRQVQLLIIRNGRELRINSWSSQEHMDIWFKAIQDAEAEVKQNLEVE